MALSLSLTAITGHQARSFYGFDIRTSEVYPDSSTISQSTAPESCGPPVAWQIGGNTLSAFDYEDRLYLSKGMRVIVLDLASPDGPSVVATSGLFPGHVYRVVRDESLLVVTTLDYGMYFLSPEESSEGLQVLGRFEHSSMPYTRLLLADKTLYAMSYSSIYAFDVSDPTDVRLTHEHRSGYRYTDMLLTPNGDLLVACADRSVDLAGPCLFRPEAGTFNLIDRQLIRPEWRDMRLQRIDESRAAISVKDRFDVAVAIVEWRKDSLRLGPYSEISPFGNYPGESSWLSHAAGQLYVIGENGELARFNIPEADALSMSLGIGTAVTRRADLCGSPVSSFRDYPCIIFGVFARDDAILLVHGRSGITRIEPGSDEQVEFARSQYEVGDLRQLAKTSDGQVLALAGYPKLPLVLEVDNAGSARIASMLLTNSVFSSPWQALGLHSPDPDTLIVATGNGLVRSSRDAFGVWVMGDTLAWPAPVRRYIAVDATTGVVQLEDRSIWSVDVPILRYERISIDEPPGASLSDAIVGPDSRPESLLLALAGYPTVGPPWGAIVEVAAQGAGSLASHSRFRTSAPIRDLAMVDDTLFALTGDLLSLDMSAQAGPSRLNWFFEMGLIPFDMDALDNQLFITSGPHQTCCLTLLNLSKDLRIDSGCGTVLPNGVSINQFNHVIGDRLLGIARAGGLFEYSVRESAPPLPTTRTIRPLPTRTPEPVPTGSALLPLLDKRR